MAEATTTTALLYILQTGDATGVMSVDYIKVEEVTPGCVAADALAMDGWEKDATLDLHREHDGSYTKAGSFYSLKATPSASNDWFGWTLEAERGAHFYEKFGGRTVTFGMWVMSDTASHVSLRIMDGATPTSSTQHTGADDTWEWLEVTATMRDAPVSLNFLVFLAQSSGVAYFSQPMLVFGSSIGEGNYTRPQGETVWFETRVILTDYNNDSVSSDADINLEAQSNGRIPKGAKAVYAKLTAQCSAADQYILLSDGDEADTLQLQSQVANVNNINTGWVPCDNVGDINIARGNTFTGVYIRTYGVQLR
jgi:hypothetical protein